MAKAPIESENHLLNKKRGDGNEAKDNVKHITNKALCFSRLIPQSYPDTFGNQFSACVCSCGCIKFLWINRKRRTVQNY